MDHARRHIHQLGKLLTEDPDVLASPEHQELTRQAARLGGDPAGASQVRKQMEQQKRQQQQDRQQQQKKLDPFFTDLEDAEDDLEQLQTTMSLQDQERSKAVDLMSRKVPKIDRALDGIRGNLPR